MPLPDNPGAASLAWPPAVIAGGMRKWHEWSAWYSGDPGGLAAHYAGEGVVGGKVRPSQYAGGVVGTVARWFWGAPATVGQSRAKLHLPIASDIATASADLLYAEAVKITAPTELKAAAPRPAAPAPGAPAVAVGRVPSPAEQRLEYLLDGTAFDSFLPEQAELTSALGGVYHRIVWDELVADHPLVTAVPADCAWPEFRFGRMVAVTFWDTAYRSQDGQRVIRILERHERGRIETGVYEGSDDKLGARVDFGALDNLGLPRPTVDADSGVDTGYDGLTATYVPNLRPVRNLAWRRDPLLSTLGRSDLDGIEGLLDAADETMTAWLRDLRLAKARLIVPETMLSSRGGEGGGTFFNIDQEVFTGVNAAIDAEKPLGDMLTAQQFAIRTQEHADTLAGILAAAFRGAGYSQQTFGIAGEAEGAATATEVNARESRSARTREKKSRYQTDAIPRTLQALLAVDAHVFGGAWDPNCRPDVEFPDIARPDPEVEARTIQTLRAAQAISILQSVKRVHPDWDDLEVEQEVARIVDDEKKLQPAIPSFGPLPGDPNADPEEGDPEGDPSPAG